MADQKFINDLKDLMTAAETAIREALQHGSEGGHLNGDWLVHPMEHHLRHAMTQLQALLSPAEDVLHADQLKADLAHLVCRTIMAYSKASK